jgi:hypothetical protein
MREVVPGLFHWSAFHPGIRHDVSSYYVLDSGVLIDPLLPADGFEDGGDAFQWLADNGPPQVILLSNRHHYRHSGRLVEAFGIPVRASRPGMHEFSSEQRVEPFDFGDELRGGVIAHEVDAICPDETALEIPTVRAVALADGLVRFDALDDPLGFVPDWLLGDDPEEVKRGLLASFERLLDLDFEHVLLAHGLPLVGDGKERLREFVEGHRTRS